jgi:hypothetical protein
MNCHSPLDHYNKNLPKSLFHLEGQAHEICSLWLNLAVVGVLHFQVLRLCPKRYNDLYQFDTLNGYYYLTLGLHRRESCKAAYEKAFTMGVKEGEERPTKNVEL